MYSEVNVPCIGSHTPSAGTQILASKFQSLYTVPFLSCILLPSDLTPTTALAVPSVVPPFPVSPGHTLICQVSF